jgi:hypothetical protein
MLSPESIAYNESGSHIFRRCTFVLAEAKEHRAGMIGPLLSFYFIFCLSLAEGEEHRAGMTDHTLIFFLLSFGLSWAQGEEHRAGMIDHTFIFSLLSFCLSFAQAKSIEHGAELKFNRRIFELSN